MKSSKNKNTPTQVITSKSPVTNHSNIFLPHWLALIIICLLGIIIYSNSFDCSFHFDDENNITKNVIILKQPGVTAIWNYTHNRFLPFISLAFNYKLDGLNVWGYHLFNLLIHLINAVLIYWIVLLVFSTPVQTNSYWTGNKRKIAFFTALLFVSHPLATQSVTYIIQRLASMVAMFYFLAIALYIKGRISDSKILRYACFAGVLLSTIAAIHTKENAYTLPFAILFTELCLFYQGKLRNSFNDKRLWLAAALLIIGITVIFLNFDFSIFKTIPPALGNPNEITASRYFLTQFSVIIKYIQLLAIPVNLNLDYDYPLSTGFFEPSTFFCFLIILGLIAIAIYQYNRNRIITYCIGWYFITLSIESSIVPIADVIFEHRTYLPSLGFLLLAASFIISIGQKKSNSFPTIMLILLTGIYSILTFQRNKIWIDDEVLYSDVISKSPEKPRAYGSRADYFRKQNRFDEAIPDYNKAIELNPNYAAAYHNRGLIYYYKNMYDKSMSDYSKTISLDSNYTEAFFNRGIIWIAYKQYDKAIEDNSMALKLDSNYNSAYFNRGSVYNLTSQWEKGISDFTRIINSESDFKNAYFNRAISYANINKNAEAISDYTNASTYDPQNASIYYNRGIIFNKIAEYNKSIADYSKAIELNPKYAEAYVNRGFDYSTIGEYEKAIKDFDIAISINPGLQNAYTLKEIALKRLGK